MSGVSLSVDVRGGARAELLAMISRIEDKRSFFTAASLMMRDQTMDRFTAQRDPNGRAWEPLADATVEARGGRAKPILEDTGSFRAQISPQPEADRAVVTTGPFVQAAILQFGGQAGRGLKTTIPARPYFGFGDGDIDDLTELAEVFFMP